RPIVVGTKVQKLLDPPFNRQPVGTVLRANYCKDAARQSVETSSGIRWFVASFPFDVAAETRLLNRGNGMSREDRIESRSQIPAIVGFVIARAAVIQLPAVD